MHIRFKRERRLLYQVYLTMSHQSALESLGIRVHFQVYILCTVNSNQTLSGRKAKCLLQIAS